MNSVTAYLSSRAYKETTSLRNNLEINPVLIDSFVETMLSFDDLPFVLMEGHVKHSQSKEMK